MVVNIVLVSSQVYEKKVSSLTNFNIENRGVANSGPRVNALNTPRLTQALHLPKVGAHGSANLTDICL